MDRAEQAGLGVAVAGHVALFGVLSLAMLSAPKPNVPLTPPVDIEIVDSVALTAAVPNPSPVAPAASVAPEVGPPEDVVPEPAPAPVVKAVVPPPPAPTIKPALQPKAVMKPKPVAAAKPTPPKPITKAAAPSKPVAKPAPSKVPATKLAQAEPRGSRLGSDFLKGISDRPTASTAQAPRAPLGALAQASIGRLIRDQLRPHWKAPTGADAEQLRTELRVRLARDGSVTQIELIGTKGVTDSNRGQVRLHQEAAMKAVRLASPFSGLPAEYYDSWSLLETVGFDKRLG